MSNNGDFLEGLCILICNYKTSAVCSSQKKGEGEAAAIGAEEKLLDEMAALICLEAL